ncbi:MAG: hypothetical protein HXY24_16605, partial [Rubrivivax sp.]|nr:hypothetical protein [Rubrivivax sp.]
MNTMRPVTRLAAVLVLLGSVPAMAQGERTVTLSFRGAKLSEVVSTIADAAGMKVLIAPDVDPNVLVTCEFDGVSGEQALRLVIRPLKLELKQFDDIWMVTRSTTEAPPRPVNRPERPTQPTPPSRPAGVNRDRGGATVQPKRYEKIILKYAYSPGIAVLLGGSAILNSDLDPFSFGRNGFGSPFGGALGGGFGGVFGGNGLGGGFGGFGQGGFRGNQGGFGGFGQGGFGGFGQGGFGQSGFGGAGGDFGNFNPGAGGNVGG